MKLYRHRGWQQAENERAYLARVAWRTAIDLRRSRAALPVAPEPLDCADDAPSHDIGPEQSLLSADEQTRLHTMIDALPEELRVPLVLSSFEEMNSKAVGSVLGIPEGTVRTRLLRTRLLRARQMLRERLARQSIHRSEAGHA